MVASLINFGLIDVLHVLLSQDVLNVSNVVQVVLIVFLDILLSWPLLLPYRKQ